MVNPDYFLESDDPNENLHNVTVGTDSTEAHEGDIALKKGQLFSLKAGKYHVISQEPPNNQAAIFTYIVTIQPGDEVGTGKTPEPGMFPIGSQIGVIPGQTLPPEFRKRIYRDLPAK